MYTNLGLVEHVKQALSEKWGYVWGTFGQVLTPDLFAAKVRQYPDGVGQYFDFIKSHWVGRRTSDCVGLIKSYYWNNGVNYNGATDASADSMYALATEKGLMNTIPDVPGICVHKTGHIGVYIGNGQVIEAHGTMYGVIQTPLFGAGSTPWTGWCKCPYITYVGGSSAPVSTNTGSTSSSVDIKGLQVVLNSLGYRDENGIMLDTDGILGGHTRAALAKAIVKRGDTNALVGWIQRRLNVSVDNSYGKAPYHETYDAICNIQRSHGLSVDGIVGPNTWNALIS
jgi:hypothetical protein